MPLALAGALATLLLFWIQGFPRLAEPGIDNDSLMRLVQVRDLLGGQGWFDLLQYRMGPDGGFVMHWSRLVDAPIAALILLFRPFVGNTGAEFAAAIVWPTAVMVAWLLALLRAASAYGGESARLPALVLGTAAFHFLGTFAAGSLDHHNVQLALVMVMVAALGGSGSLRAGAVAGGAAAASMAVGMETILYVAAAGISVALLFWLRGEARAPLAAGFGYGFAGIAALGLVLASPPSGWFSTACDAFSGAQAGSAVLAGLGLVAATRFAGKRSGGWRLAALAVLGVASAALVLAVYPHCLAEPYSGFVPRLREYWLGGISEAQSLRALLANEPETVALYYATPLVGFGLLCRRLLRGGSIDETLPLFILLAVAIAASAWQVRAAIFSIAVAVIPLSAWVGDTRTRAASAGSSAAAMKMTAAWLVSLNVVWGVAGLLIFDREAVDGQAGSSAGKCHAGDDFAGLARLPAGTVLAGANLGPAILAFSSHRALAGLYHRNEEGNLAMLDAMTGTPAEALAIARRYGIDYVAVCPGNPETGALAKWAPDGLLATIARGEPVEWLEPALDGEGALHVFRVIDP